MRKLSFANAIAIARATAAGLATMLVAPSFAAASVEISPSEVLRFTSAARVVEEIRPAVPQDYWDRARCVVLVPELRKAAFIVGGEYGRGVMSCRAGSEWSAPAFMQLAKGSWGFQEGAEQVDLVLLVMNDQGVQKLLQSKVTLGVDASAAAGPIGRRGEVGTDGAFTAEILSYSRAQGLFAGVDVAGGILRPDEDANRAVYGNGASRRTILASREISAPTEAAVFLRALSTGSPTSTAAMTTSGASLPPGASSSPGASSLLAGSRSSAGDEDLRSQIADLQRALDRILADPAASAAPTGTAGSTAASGTVCVDRDRLLQVRQQLNALLAAFARP